MLPSPKSGREGIHLHKHKVQKVELVGNLEIDGFQKAKQR